MDIVVTGRHCTISPELKELVRDRIVTVERLRDRVIRVEVEFSATDGTKNPSDAVEVQITLRSRGPVVRAEAKANDKTLAFEQAFDRRKTHRGLRTAFFAEEPASAPVPEETENEPEEPTYEVAGLVVNGDGPLVVREKEFETVPLSLAQALDEMELVGHDFFLYQDSATGKPSVVYRRKAYNYGVIHLNVNV